MILGPGANQIFFYMVKSWILAAVVVAVAVSLFVVLGGYALGPLFFAVAYKLERLQEGEQE